MCLFSFLPSHFVVLLKSPLSETVLIFSKLNSQWHSFFNDSFNKNHNNNNNRGNQQWRQQLSASFATSSCCRTWREVLAGIVNSFGFLRNVCPSLGLGARQARLGAARLLHLVEGGGGGHSLRQEFVFKIWRTRPFGRQKAAATICKLRMNKT